ncbi:MAG: hypothetical protein Q8896_10330 [Bacteroidota bacterium]|nr:hypothetical protein [Bacteroidota bacterium]
MTDDSIGRGERQARALVMLVLVIEALWIFFHKYLPLDASLWALQSDAVREHLSGHGNDGLKMIPIPAANTLVPLISGILSFLFSGEVVTRLLIVFVGIILRGFAMLSLLRVMRVREELVYFLIPIFLWSGAFFIGSLPYLVGETLALALITHLLRQDHPRSGTYWFLAIGFAVVALCHALAFLAIIALVLSVANEQRRSVHLSQGWLSNIRSVAGLIVPGCFVLALRIFYPAPIFMLSSSGLIPDGGLKHLVFALTATPFVREAAFPGSDILAITIATTVLLLVITSLARAFLLPMEEVSWQSRSAKGAGGILVVLALLGFVLTPLGIETSGFIWFAAFLLVAGSYSRGPAARRGAVDRILRSIGFIAMIAAGLFNGVSTNRGSEAASEIRDGAIKLVRGEFASAKSDDHLDTIAIRFVLDSALIESMSESPIGSFSYSCTAPNYIYGIGNPLSRPSQFQPEAGILDRQDKSPSGASPARPIYFPSPEQYFDPRFRVLAALKQGAALSSNFGPYARSFTDTTGITADYGLAKYRLVIGKLSPRPVIGLALISK